MIPHAQQVMLISIYTYSCYYSNHFWHTSEIRHLETLVNFLNKKKCIVKLTKEKQYMFREKN